MENTNFFSRQAQNRVNQTIPEAVSTHEVVTGRIENPIEEELAAFRAPLVDGQTFRRLDRHSRWKLAHSVAHHETVV